MDKNIRLKIKGTDDILLKWFPSDSKDIRIEEKSIKVQVTDEYWISDYIKRKQWHFLGFPPSDSTDYWSTKKKSKGLEDLLLDEKNDNVAGNKNVNWFEAINFCNAINLKMSDEKPDGYCFSLPTESQWELAFNKMNIKETGTVGEWCFDDYVPIPSIAVDWIGSGRSNVKSCREIFEEGDINLQRSYLDPYYPRLNFRICLRRC